MNILGIDIAKDGMVIAWIPEENNHEPKHYPTKELDYQSTTWPEELINHIDPDGALIVAEPTGMHLLQPVIAIINLYRPHTSIWLTDHHLSAHYRQTYLSDAKNDRLDAIAIALIARDIADGKHPRHCRPYDPSHETEILALRLLINQHFRLTKDIRRLKQRLHILAHSMFPVLAGSPTWLNAAQAGYVTPKQIIELAATTNPPPPFNDGRVHRHLKNLAATLHPVAVNPIIEAAIHNALSTYAPLQDEIQQLEADIAKTIYQPPLATITRRWMTFPYATPVTIGALHVATHGRTLELSRDEFKAAVGTNPISNESGNRKSAKTTRKGYKPIRAHLYMWTYRLLSTSAPPNPIRDYYNEGRSIWQARTKLARVLWGIARNASLDDKTINEPVSDSDDD